MITSIFNKSKPINFVIVFFIMLLAFSVANLKAFIESISIVLFFKKTATFFICYFTILIFNFVVVKNSLSKNNHYQILLFSLFFLMFPETTVNADILFANIFILMGLRRLLSLRTQIKIKKKLFDTAVWFAVATFFYFWAVLFFALIFVTLFLYTDNRVKNWIIPFVGFATVVVISISASIIFCDDFFEIINMSTTISYNYSSYNTPQYLIAITLLLSFGVWSSIFYVKLVQKKKKAFKPSFKIVFVAVIIAFVTVILSPQKNRSEFLFLFAPLSIIMTNYIESIKEKWFKEVFLSILILVPLVLLML
ncbi:MAG: DUF6427 family protein [Flavobacteriaceae bacterium]|nr:DUF6427 family protein [Flavobacteriaceae bacterium]